MSKNKKSINRQYIKDQQSWLVSRWRPATAWVYLVVCLFDFVIGPIFYAWFAATTGIIEFGGWQPLTIEGGGIFHLSMGAILGVTAFTRGQEKVTAMQVFKTEEFEESDGVNEYTEQPNEPRS